MSTFFSNVFLNSQNHYNVRLKTIEEIRWFDWERLKLITNNECEDFGLNFSSCTFHDVASLRSDINLLCDEHCLSVNSFLINNILIFILTTLVEKTRVKLSGDSDYINANHVKVVCLSMLQIGKNCLIIYS